MFYCDRCKRKFDYPMSFAKSFGRCEICGEEKVCNDVPSSQLNSAEKKSKNPADK